MSDNTVDLPARTRDLVGSAADRIRLLELLTDAVKHVRTVVDEHATGDLNADRYGAAIESLTEASAPLATSLAWTVEWGLPEHDRIVVGELQRLADIADQDSGVAAWLALRWWPAALAIAAVGTAAVDAKRETLLGEVMSQVVLRQPSGPGHAAELLAPARVLEDGLIRQAWNRNTAYTPADDHVFERLNQWLVSDLVPSEPALTDAFDRYQYLAGCLALDERVQRGRGPWGPVGSFGWRRQYGWTVPIDVRAELAAAGVAWPLLAGGGFGGDTERAQSAMEAYQDLVERGRF